MNARHNDTGRVMLQGPSVVSFIRELIAAGVAEHMRMDSEGQFRPCP